MNKDIFFYISTLFISSLMLTSCNKKDAPRVHSVLEFTTKLKANENISHEFKVDKSSEIDKYSNSNTNVKVADFKTKKYKQYGLNGAIIGQPVVLEDRVYTITSSGHVHSYDKTTFKKVWSTFSGSVPNVKKYSYGGIAAVNNKLFVTNGTKDIVVLDAKTGDILVSSQLPNVSISTPVVAESKVIVSMIDNSVVALETSSLKQVWMQSFVGDSIAYDSRTFPTIYKDQVIVYLSSGNIITYNIHNGTTLSNYNILNNSGEVFLPDLVVAGVSCQPLLSDNLLYVPSKNGDLFVFDLEKKSLIATKKDFSDIQNITKIGNTIFIVNSAKQVAALTENLNIIWVADLGDSKSSKVERFLPIVLVNNDLVAISDAGKLYTIDYKTGKVLGKYNSISNANSILSYGDHLYIFGRSAVSNF